MMQLDAILDEWHKDCQIDRTELGEAALNIPQLHSKYYKMFSSERLALKRLEAEYKSLAKAKWEYYQGLMDLEDLREWGWEPNPLKILKQDLDRYIDSDPDIIQLTMKISYAKEKVDFLDNVIRSLNTRGYNIRAAIDWEKFKMGAI